MKKMPMIFTRNPSDMNEVLQEENPLCKWVFSGEGIAKRKYDGTCCLIDKGFLFKRREVKKGKPIPEYFVHVGHDPITNKIMGWLPVDFTDKENQWHIEAFHHGLTDGTYELIGPKVQGNPENYNVHTLIKHSEVESYDNVPREFMALKEWIKDKDIEGLVFYHPNGDMAKIRKGDFNLKREG